jgi:predicted P-loop ATPase
MTNIVTLEPARAHRNRAQEDHTQIPWPERTKSGDPKGKSLKNIRFFLNWVNVQLSFDDSTHRILVSRDSRMAVVIDDDGLFNLWAEADEFGLQPPIKYFATMLRVIARERTFHPVLNYLNGLSWDGQLRLDRWLHTCLGAEDTPLNAAFGRKHLIAGVSRILKPGAKHDAILVMTGTQGIGKSTAIKALCPDETWFTDNLPLGSSAKVVIEQTAGKWIVENAELEGLDRGKTAAIKAQASRQVDGQRLSYGILRTDRLRQFLLFATGNKAEFLTDPTGNRRFWPVKVAGLRDADMVARVAEVRDQLWAEAVEAYRRGEDCLLPRELWNAAAVIQKDAVIPDPWNEVLEQNVEGRDLVERDEVSVVLSLAPRECLNPKVAARIRDCMHSLGFELKQRRPSRRRVWVRQ